MIIIITLKIIIVTIITNNITRCHLEMVPVQAHIRVCMDTVNILTEEDENDCQLAERSKHTRESHEHTAYWATLFDNS